MATGLLTPTWRKYLRGEVEDWEESRVQSETSKIRKRLAYGFHDIALAGENMDKLGDLSRVFLKHRTGDNPEADLTKGREGWRDRPFRDVVEPVLAFLLSQSEVFNYSSADWERWMKRAYETVHPEGYAHVKFETIQDLEIDELSSIFHGNHEKYDRDYLRNVEIQALYEHGEIETEEWIEAMEPVDSI